MPSVHVKGVVAHLYSWNCFEKVSSRGFGSLWDWTQSFVTECYSARHERHILNSAFTELHDDELLFLLLSFSFTVQLSTDSVPQSPAG